MASTDTVKGGDCIHWAAVKDTSPAGREKCALMQSGEGGSLGSLKSLVMWILSLFFSVLFGGHRVVIV